MILRREFFAHRQAYSPRWWPTLAVGAVVMYAAAELVVPWSGGPLARTLEGVLLGAAVAAVVVQGRWAIWRRRHPELSPEEYAEVVLRRRAPYN